MRTCRCNSNYGFQTRQRRANTRDIKIQKVKHFIACAILFIFIYQELVLGFTIVGKRCATYFSPREVLTSLERNQQFEIHTTLQKKAKINSYSRFQKMAWDPNYSTSQVIWSQHQDRSPVSMDDEPRKPKPSKRRIPSFWLARKPRGTNLVIMREAVELGGVPRGDRYSSRDWFHNTISLPNSEILRSIRSPILAVTSWATFLSLLQYKMSNNVLLSAYIEGMYIPVAPHSMMMSALGLLLVFRTNSAYQRFAEGRAIWERIINTARDLSRMMILYNDEIGIDKRRRLQRLLVSYPYLLRHRIRPNLVMHRVGDENIERDPKYTILLYQDTGTKDNDINAAMLAKVEEETGRSRRKKRPLYFVDKRTLPWRLVPHEALEKVSLHR
jgi:Bestrophin, RFP-TM, chloride channel